MGLVKIVSINFKPTPPRVELNKTVALPVLMQILVIRMSYYVHISSNCDLISVVMCSPLQFHFNIHFFTESDM